jgi:hypothetical protein
MTWVGVARWRLSQQPRLANPSAWCKKQRRKVIMANCPNCGNQVGEGAVFCDQCGTRLPQPEAAVPEPAAAPAGGSVICPACGAGNVPGEAFCDYCGSPMEPPVPTVEEVPELEPVSSEAELEAPPAEVEEPAPPRRLRQKRSQPARPARPKYCLARRFAPTAALRWQSRQSRQSRYPRRSQRWN